MAGEQIIMTTVGARKAKGFYLPSITLRILYLSLPNQALVALHD